MKKSSSPVLIVGGGVGGLAAAVALAHRGLDVKVLEQAADLGEIGAGIQVGPNGLAALNALGVGESIRSQMVCVDELTMRDGTTQELAVRVPTGNEFLKRFGNPYAVIYRTDLLQALIDRVKDSDRIEVVTSCAVTHIDQDRNSVAAHDNAGRTHRGMALIGADGVKSVVRSQYVGDSPRVSGDVIYRSVFDPKHLPPELRTNASNFWVGPGRNIAHYPLRGGKLHNLVVLFHSRKQEQLGVTEGSAEEMASYHEDVCPLVKRLLAEVRNFKRWTGADREPIDRWIFGPGGRTVLLGDSAHATLPFLSQGACMALEDAVTLGESLRVHPNDIVQAFELFWRSRKIRTARIVFSSRVMRSVYYAGGMERQVRNEMWRNRSAGSIYDSLEWLWAWRADNCLAT